jgi:hypothetical protein
MAIKSNTDSERFVFHSIDMDSQSGGRTIFTCHKDLFDKARSICSSLVLYMQNYVGPDYVHAINKCFTKKALNDAGGEWHKATQQVLTKAEIRSLALKNSDQGAGYNEVIHIENILVAAAKEPIQLAKDDDTISAMTTEKNVRPKLKAWLLAHNAVLATQANSHILISAQDTVSTLTSNTPNQNTTKNTNDTTATVATKASTNISNSTSPTQPPKLYIFNPYMSSNNTREFTLPSSAAKTTTPSHSNKLNAPPAQNVGMDKLNTTVNTTNSPNAAGSNKSGQTP